ncbi:SDR family oxidoreductase [Pseudonocardia sp. C8]|uniref:SDR family NAD(P)-dependent oxidoreductase n=1 Tax=Pseudonocardia sp. C8 TaxID=2762759 RepID=UPI00164347CD|nr:SDR family oxidoreductase [Pseudonocardia sp. C8]MBC3191724.1 SDR family oxidoreductase [Pseudonocardia sp. C8]
MYTPRRPRPERALITGAAGGVGSATARRLVADGARVALTDIDQDRVRALAAEIGSAAVVLPADGTDSDGVAAVVEGAVGELGGLDTVVAAQGAAVGGGVDPRHTESWNRALDVNLHGTFHVAGSALPHLVEASGSLVLLASTAGLIAGPPGAAGYTAAKAAVIGLTRWLARDYGPRGVRVNAVCPGFVRTPLAQGSMAYLAKREGITADEAFALSARHVPLRRVAEPEEIAACCAFLASGDASMVTGHVLVADGGGAAVDASTVAFDPPPVP